LELDLAELGDVVGPCCPTTHPNEQTGELHAGRSEPTAAGPDSAFERCSPVAPERLSVVSLAASGVLADSVGVESVCLVGGLLLLLAAAVGFAP